MENNEQQKSECKSCKSKNPVKSPSGMIIIGSYILISACYGTVTFIKEIIAFFAK
jgi:hypothetical protein